MAEPLKSPYATETIVVPSLGMERWLVSELSRRFGVWTNAEHPLPRAFVEQILRSLDPQVASFDAWDSQHLGFSIAQYLSDAKNSARWPQIRNYLEGDANSERCLELGYQIADTFDQYLVYRPDWIEAWQRHERADISVEPWQGELFLELVARLGQDHFANRLRLALARLQSENISLETLPERICCFQVGLLPQSYLQLLEGLGRRIPTHLFVLSPSREHLNICRERHRQVEDTAVAAMPSNERTERQPLFASLCRQARELDYVLAKLVESRPGREQYVEVAPRNALELLQADICALRHRKPTGEIQPCELLADDRSIEIHACHSKRREIEVLREVLLDAFETDPSLAPEDVLVMLADIQAYAPLVDALFGAKERGYGHIPYTIADRSLRSFNNLADSLLKLLELLSQRITIDRLLDLLSLELVQLRFEIGADRLARIEQWLARLQIVWGADSADRQSVGAPPAEEHTLRFGLSRLLLGIALDSKLAPTYASRAPFDLEGEDAELAGRVVETCETLLEFRSRLTKDQTIESYSALLERLINEVFFVDRESIWQKTEICDSLGEFARAASEAGFVATITFHSLRQALKARFEATPSARSFLSGGVTFCKMLPLRSIPFRVIAMVGLEDGQFPRHDRRSSFNALNRNERTGDRRVSDEDRFLFAESLLACRERFIITYVGRSARDDSTRPASVVVEELLYTIDESFQPLGDSSQPARDVVLHVEALQPFSPRYFDSGFPGMVNRSAHHFRAAQALTLTHSEPTVPGYSTFVLPQLNVLQHRDLVDLLRNPTRLYLEKKLHVAVDPKLQRHEGTEPITLDALAEWRITKELIQGHLKRENEQSTIDRLRASGELPILAMGDVAIDSLRQRAASLLHAAAPWCHGEQLNDQWVSIMIDGVQIEGWLDSNWPSAHVHLRPSRLTLAGIVEAWVEHLCINANGNAIATVIIARAIQGHSVVTREFAPLDPGDATAQLGCLISDYRLACAVPIPFWLGPAQVYYDARRNENGHEIALFRAQAELAQMRSEGRLDSHFESLYGTDPCVEQWPALAGMPQVLSFSQWTERWLGPIYSVLTIPASNDFADQAEGSS